MSTQTLSGSRAGAGSAVVTEDAVARTVPVAGVGVVVTGATGGGGGGGGGASSVRVVVLA